MQLAHPSKPSTARAGFQTWPGMVVLARRLTWNLYSLNSCLKPLLKLYLFVNLHLTLGCRLS